MNLSFNSFRSSLLAAILPVAATLVAAEPAPPTTLTIETSQPTAKVSPMLYGLMTEEINYCYDGGLYAELVRNRAFKDNNKNPVHWSVVAGDGSAATITLDPKQPLNAALSTSLRLDVTSASPTASAGVANSGYWGIPVKPNTSYRASVSAKAASGFSGPLSVSLVSDDGKMVYAQAEIKQLSENWQQSTVTLTTAPNVGPTTKARLTLTVQHPGTVWLGLVSLFPPTWNDRPNGLRKDLMQMLVDLKPAFLRFPGGNYLEGDSIETRFEWKKTLGPITGRAGHPGTWGYRSSDGMGLHEFLLWCEDMNAEPLLGLYAGYSLKGVYVKPGPDLEPFIQEALEEIEYVTGDVSTKWGAERAKNGHPAPFKLRYVEIGNEDWFDKSLSYDGRYAQFADAIAKKYPKLKCISTVGNEQPPNKRVHSRKPDVLDEHYYRNTESFLKDSPKHFDKYDRKGPEIFVGEWAAHETAFPPWDKQSKGLPATPTLKAALGDAAFMAAMERNSDIVTMHCYAPLFANLNNYQWRPDLIGYDALRAYGAPSYYAIKMFSTNVGDAILKATFDGPTPGATPALHHSVTRDTKTGTLYVKIVNASDSALTLTLNLKGVSNIGTGASATVLTSASINDTNSLDEPTKVVPVTTPLPGLKPSFGHSFPANSVTVLTLPAR